MPLRLYSFVSWGGSTKPEDLGEVIPENVYSDRAFQYLSDVRRAEAEEWIGVAPRVSLPRTCGAGKFPQGLIRLEEGLLTIETLPEETKGQAFLSLIGEIEKNFNITLTLEELTWLRKWRSFPNGKDLFSQIKKLLSKLHLRGVVKFPSNDQKFVSESNATREIEVSMISFVSDLVILSDLENGLRFLLEPEEVEGVYPYL